MKKNFEDWIQELEVDVVQDHYGYEPGEFTVYPDHWKSMFDEGLAPSQAFERALNAHNAQREEDDRLRQENYERIKAEDEATLARYHAQKS